MKKTAIASAVATIMGLGIGTASATDMNSATFSMWSPYGFQVNPAGNDTTVAGSIGFSAWAVSSTRKFFGAVWTAHAGSTFGPGTYTFNTVEGPSYTNVQVGAAQVGGHILFDWNGTYNIDVINVWDVVNRVDGTTKYTSIQVSSSNTAMLKTICDNKPGAAMIDGPFAGNCANFDFVIPSPPDAVNDSIGTTTDTLVTINLAANDSAAALLDTASVNPPAIPPAAYTVPAASTQGGTISDNGDGTVDYTPPAAFNGQDTFTYTLTDEEGRVSAPATVTVTVSAAANNPPVANNVEFSTNEDTAKVINIADMDDMGADIGSDLDGDTLSFATAGPATSQGGTVAINGAKDALTYTPKLNFNGTDTFNFTVTDGIDNSAPATMTITVAAVNDGLLCTDVNKATPTDTPLVIDAAADLLSTCVDPDGDTISLVSYTQPTQAGATVTDNGAGVLTYTPPTGYQGVDSFTYTATDGTVTDIPRTVSITVSGTIYGNFTMLAADGQTFGGTNDVIASWDGSANTSETSTNFNLTFDSESSWPFNGFDWTAHDARVFAPGTYQFDTTCTVAQVQAGTGNNCGGTASEIYTLVVPAGMLGGHILFDWNTTKDIDVLNLWEQNASFVNPVAGGELYNGPAGPTPNQALAKYELVSRDADGDTVPGARMIDGPFIGLRPNFNLNFTVMDLGGGGTATAPPTTAATPSTGGCSLDSTGATASQRGHWWLLAGFISWLGLNRRRRSTRRQS